MPHCSTVYVDAAYCYRPSSMVCRSVVLSVAVVSSAKMAELIEILFVWVVNWTGTKEPCIRWGTRSPIERGNFKGEKGRPVVKYNVSQKRPTFALL